MTKQKRLDEVWALRKDSVRILRVVVAAWAAAPATAKPFDPIFVARANEVIARLDELEREEGT